MIKMTIAVIVLSSINCALFQKEQERRLHIDSYVNQKYEKGEISSSAPKYILSEISLSMYENACLNSLENCYDDTELLTKIENAYRENEKAYNLLASENKKGIIGISNTSILDAREKIQNLIRPIKLWYSAKNEIVYGCYCGCGNNPNKHPTCSSDVHCCQNADPDAKNCPCDRLDCLCKEHDACYQEARKENNISKKLDKENICDKEFFEAIDDKVLKAPDRNIDSKHKQTTLAAKAPYILFKMKYLANKYSPSDPKYKISFLGKDANEGCKKPK